MRGKVRAKVHWSGGILTIVTSFLRSSIRFLSCSLAVSGAGADCAMLGPGTASHRGTGGTDQSDQVWWWRWDRRVCEVCSGRGDRHSHDNENENQADSSLCSRVCLSSRSRTVRSSSCCTEPALLELQMLCCESMPLAARSLTADPGSTTRKRANVHRSVSRCGTLFPLLPDRQPQSPDSLRTRARSRCEDTQRAQLTGIGAGETAVREQSNAGTQTGGRERAAADRSTRAQQPFPHIPSQPADPQHEPSVRPHLPLSL